MAPLCTDDEHMLVLRILEQEHVGHTDLVLSGKFTINARRVVMSVTASPCMT